MNNDNFIDEIANIYPDSEIKVLSTGNNKVVSISVSGKTYIAKQILDSDLPIEYMNSLNDLLSSSLPVQKLIKFSKKNTPPFLISEFVAGKDLSQYLYSAIGDEELDNLASYFCRYISSCANLPRMHDKFGLFKNNDPSFKDHQSFITYYAFKYWSRVRPFITDTQTIRWIDNWVYSDFAKATIAYAFQTISVDSNLRNFIRSNDGEIVLLNVPIVGYSSRQHAVAAVSVHLRHTSLYAPFLNLATKEFSLEECRAVQHFELWQLLGILSFYAVKYPKGMEKWKNWGSPVSLLDELNETLSILSD